MNFCLLQDNYFITFIKERVNYLKPEKCVNIDNIEYDNEEDNKRFQNSKKQKKNSKKNNESNQKDSDDPPTFDNLNIKITKNVKSIKVTIKKENPTEIKHESILLLAMDIISSYLVFNLLLFLINQEDYNIFVILVYHLIFFILMMKVRKFLF